MFRLTRFMLISQYLAEHIDDFDVGDFAVVGSDEAGALVARHLLRAVHEIITTRSLAKLGHGPSPEEVLCLAASYREAPTEPGNAV